MVSVKPGAFREDKAVSRIRDHALAMDRCKRYVSVVIYTFDCGLRPVEWAVFNYFSSLKPSHHPSSVEAAQSLRIGRTSLGQSLQVLEKRGMVFLDREHLPRQKNKKLIVNISHPCHWAGVSGVAFDAATTDPKKHRPRFYDKAPERINEARAYALAEN